MNNEIQHQFKHVSHLLNSLDNIINKYKLEDKKTQSIKFLSLPQFIVRTSFPIKGKY